MRRDPFGQTNSETLDRLSFIIPEGRYPRQVEDFGLPLPGYGAQVAGKAGALAVLGELLGRRKRRRRATGAAHFGANKRRHALKKFKALSPAQQKAKLAEAVKRASPGTKKRLLRLAAMRALKIKRNAAKLAKALAKNPKLKRVVVKRLVRRKLQNLAKNSTDWRGPRLATSDAQSAVPQGEHPTPPPTACPVQPAVEEDHAPTTQETTEAMAEEQALDTSEAQDEANEEAKEEVEEQTEEAAEESADAANDDELTEPTAEEAEEEAEEDADEEEAEESSDADETAGVSMLGALKKASKKKARQKRVLHAAKPTAHALHKKSGGKIPAGDTMKGCALIQAAKAGNPKAKAAIKVLQAAAAKGDPAAVKTLAQLKVCNGVLKKARKSVAKRVAAPPKAGKKRTVYNTPVKVVTKGLQSYSAHQRGLAMIPTTARSMFRGVRGDE